MRILRRQFLKLSLGGSAALLMGPLSRPGWLLAAAESVPPNPLEERIHRYWMKLSYNHGLESRQTRRALGVALRAIGALRGKGRGYSFLPCLDQAVIAAFQRSVRGGTKPTSLFGLIQMLYDDFIFPKTGPAGGTILFGMLLAILRGQDGTETGQIAYRSYLAYRQAALDFKNAYKTSADAGAILEARKKRLTALQLWQRNWRGLVELYAGRKLKLNPNVLLTSGLMAGFDRLQDSPPAPGPRLTFSRGNGQLSISWKGTAKLQQAPGPLGPWTDTQQSSPASFRMAEPMQFFRALQVPVKPTP